MERTGLAEILLLFYMQTFFVVLEVCKIQSRECFVLIIVLCTDTTICLLLTVFSVHLVHRLLLVEHVFSDVLKSLCIYVFHRVLRNKGDH